LLHIFFNYDFFERNVVAINSDECGALGNYILAGVLESPQLVDFLACYDGEILCKIFFYELGVQVLLLVSFFL